MVWRMVHTKIRCATLTHDRCACAAEHTVVGLCVCVCVTAVSARTVDFNCK